jgi:PAS domain S-box-containing protein
LRDLAPQLAAVAVDEEERAAIGVDHARGGVHDELEQAIEIALRDQRLGDIEDATQLFDALLKLVHRFQHIIRRGPVETLRGLLTALYTHPGLRKTVRRVLDDYRHLFDSNPNPMLIYEVGTLLVRAVNDALLHGLGYTRDELVGQSILVLHPPEEHQRVRDVLAPVRSRQVLGFHRVGNLHHLRKDGSLVEIEAAGQPTEFEGKAARLVLFSDVGERQRAKRATARYAALFDRARDIILFIASDGRILDVNPAALRAYGYEREELLKMRIVDLREPGTREHIRHQMEKASGPGVLFETLHRRKDGQAFPVEVSSVGVDLEGDRVLLSVIRDISERRAAAKQLEEIAVNRRERRGRAAAVVSQLVANADDAEAVRKLAAELRAITSEET